jgi:hypothetical protein
MLQTLKLNNKKTEKIMVLRRKKLGRIDSFAHREDQNKKSRNGTERDRYWGDLKTFNPNPNHFFTP